MESKQNRQIGDKIKVFRAKQGLTQDALARKCDIPYTTLTKIESNVIKARTSEELAPRLDRAGSNARVEYPQKDVLNNHGIMFGWIYRKVLKQCIR
ncbi:helix-turn-helix transcriptional regulator [Candidatus Azambacteria bacterium]|nr:helix-turn-helix transcriptional regulator [Candidatus Azambacteria bacterium]